jgi:hypothetical protein
MDPQFKFLFLFFNKHMQILFAVIEILPEDESKKKLAQDQHYSSFVSFQLMYKRI